MAAHRVLPVLLIALTGVLADSLDVSIDEDIPPMGCVIRGPYYSNFYNIDYNVTVTGTSVGVDVLFAFNETDSDFTICLFSDVKDELSRYRVNESAIVSEEGVDLLQDFWIVLRNTDPGDDNATAHVVFLMHIETATLLDLIKAWWYVVAGIGGAVVLGVLVTAIYCVKRKNNQAMTKLASVANVASAARGIALKKV